MPCHLYVLYNVYIYICIHIIYTWYYFQDFFLVWVIHRDKVGFKRNRTWDSTVWWKRALPTKAQFNWTLVLVCHELGCVIVGCWTWSSLKFLLTPWIWDLMLIKALISVGTSEGILPCSLAVPWRRQWHPTPVLLPGKSHGRRSLVGCSPCGC